MPCLVSWHLASPSRRYMFFGLWLFTQHRNTFPTSNANRWSQWTLSVWRKHHLNMLESALNNLPGRQLENMFAHHVDRGQEWWDGPTSIRTGSCEASTSFFTVTASVGKTSLFIFVKKKLQRSSILKDVPTLHAVSYKYTTFIKKSQLYTTGNIDLWRPFSGQHFP